MQQLYNSADRIYNQFYKIIFLETCAYYSLIPKGLRIIKKAQSVKKDSIQNRWDNVLTDAARSLLRITIEEEVTFMRIEENEFWSAVDILRNLNSEDSFITSDWLAKLQQHTEKLEKKLKFYKARKLRTLSENLEEDVVARFHSRVEDFSFRDQMRRFTSDYFPEVEDMVTLANLSESILSFNNSLLLNSDFNDFNGEVNSDLNAFNGEGNSEVGEGATKFVHK